MNEDKGGTVLIVIEGYCVMGMYTKTYNKRFVSEVTNESWEKRVTKDKVQVYTRMVMFDHSVRKYKDVKREESIKWGKRSIFVLCDTDNTIDVVAKCNLISELG